MTNGIGQSAVSPNPTHPVITSEVEHTSMSIEEEYPYPGVIAVTPGHDLDDSIHVRAMSVYLKSTKSCSGDHVVA